MKARNDIGSRQKFRAKLDLGAGGNFEFRAKINEIHTQFGGFETDLETSTSDVTCRSSAFG